MIGFDMCGVVFLVLFSSDAFRVKLAKCVKSIIVFFCCCLGLLSLTSRCLRKAIPIKSLFQKYIMFCAKNIIVLSLLIYCFLMDGFQKIYQNNTKNEKESMVKEKKKIVSTSMFVLSSLLFSMFWCHGVITKPDCLSILFDCGLSFCSCCSVLLLTSSSLPFPFTILFCVIIQPDVMRVCETSTIGDMLVCTV